MSKPQVLTGALAIVRSGGQVIGKLRNVSATENMRRVPVRGIGTILPSESAVTEWSGSVNADMYFIDFTKSQIPGAIRRDAASNQEFEDQLVLDSQVGVQIDLFKKVEDAIDPVTKLLKSKATPIAIFSRCMITTDGINVSEGQISGRNIAFEYLDPILISVTDGN